MEVTKYKIIAKISTFKRASFSSRVARSSTTVLVIWSADILTQKWQLDRPLQKRAHWKTSPVKIGVPIRLCELKQGFKDYRHLSVPSELWAANLQFFCLTPLSRQYRYNRRINHCFEVSKCRFHRQRLQSVKYLICEMKRIPSWLKHYKQSKRCPSRGTNC